MLERPASSAVDEAVEQLGLLAQQRCGAQHVRLGRRMHGAQRGQEAVAHARARVALVVVALVLAPRQAARLAVGGGLLAREPSSGRIRRPSPATMPSSARLPGEAASR